MSRDIVVRHPGYYIDASVYDLKPSKKSKIRRENAEPVDLPQAVHQKEASHPIPETKHHLKSDVSGSERKPETLHRSAASGLDAQVYLSNAYSYANNICPLCRSVLGKELVNIPVTEANGDFYRYYADEVKFCYKCRKAYISKDTVSSILNRMTSGARTTHTVKLENATVHRSENPRLAGRCLHNIMVPPYRRSY